MNKINKRRRRRAKMIRHKNRITVAGILTDCAAEQGDARRIVDIKCNRHGVISSHGDFLIASIVIPPARYKETGTGEAAVRVRRKLDHHKIKVKLFRLLKWMTL